MFNPDATEDENENESKILKRILREINHLEAIRQKHLIDAKDKEKVG